jgi:hypothetical protein
MAETTDAPRSWVGQAVVVWARAEGHPFEDTHGRVVSGYDQAMGQFSGRFEGVNDLGTTLVMEDGRLASSPGPRSQGSCWPHSRGNPPLLTEPRQTTSMRLPVDDPIR